MNKLKKYADKVKKRLLELSPEDIDEVRSVSYHKQYKSPIYENEVPLFSIMFDKFDFKIMLPEEKDFEENISNIILAFDRNKREFIEIDDEIKVNPSKRMGTTSPKRLLYTSSGEIIKTENYKPEEKKK